MLYSHWIQGRHNDPATFELFIRKCPFKGEFTIFMGLADCLSVVSDFKFNQLDIDYLRHYIIPQADPQFWEYLKTINTDDIIIKSLQDGQVAFPKIPFMIISGPLGVAQLLETVFLNIVNYSSLMTTNAMRYRLASAPEQQLVEFGARRSQGAGASLIASKCAYLAGFSGTSNVLAGLNFGIPVVGTMAHSYIMSYKNWEQIRQKMLRYNGKLIHSDFVDFVSNFLSQILGNPSKLGHINPNPKELVAMTSYAISFPTNFVALIDSYDTLGSGIYNFIIVAVSLLNVTINYPEIRQEILDNLGVRIDSGDLAYQATQVRQILQQASSVFDVNLTKTKIIVSSDISEEVIMSLQLQTDCIDVYGIGTHLVTCKNQPALGGVYKLVDIGGQPTIKLSETLEKITIPGRKKCYRLYGLGNVPSIDLMTLEDEETPQVSQPVYCRDPFIEHRRLNFIPSRIEPLHQTYWEKGKKCKLMPTISEIKDYIVHQMNQTRIDHLRTDNPTPYKVSVSDKLYHLIHKLWLEVKPIQTLS